MQSVTMPCAKQPTSAVRAALTLIGFSAVIGQIVLMRELIVVFNGNEISLGIMLATWLFWTAAGSSLSSRFATGREQRSPGGRRARMPARRQPAADDLGIARLQNFFSDRAGRTGWSGADAAYIPGMSEPVLRCLRVAFRGCDPDVRTGVRRLCSRRYQFGVLAGGRWFRLRRDPGQHCVAALS